MRQAIRLFVGFVMLSMMLSACKKEMFDPDLAKKIMDLSFHNDTVDQYHNWTLIEDWSVQVEANVKGVRRIELLSGNPYTDENAEVVANSTASMGDVMDLSCSLPSIVDSLYVAAVDSTDHYTVVAVTPQQYHINFSTLNTVNSGTILGVGQQEMFYCFCSSYPAPSETWGFNDCVLRISKELRDSRTLRITVTLLAVGTTAQIAAALRLDGIDYDQVEKIDIVKGSNFRRAENLPRYFIKDESLKLRGQDGSAVINLFDDAHAAFYSKTNNQGIVYRYRYNVKHGNSSDCYEFSQPSVSYDVVFKNEGIANFMTYTLFDPFILVNYAGTTWEVHKYKFKFNETLYSYFSGNPQAYNNGYTWALEIPYTWFRYPSADNSMGSYKKGALYGAYQTFGHSFGEWGADRKSSNDWYLYPNTSMVY